MKLFGRFGLFAILTGWIGSCAPITVQSYSVEYVYENRRVVDVGDPAWSEKIVYTFDSEKTERVISGAVYEEGDGTKPVAFLLFTYWDLENLSNRVVDNRLHTVERYSDNDIFKTENGVKTKDPVRAASRLICYDVYETDPKDGKCLSVKTYRYNGEDPVIENRNVPMRSTEYKYFSNVTDRFLPEEEMISLFLVDRWVYQSAVRTEYKKVGGKKQPAVKYYYINPLSDRSLYAVETYMYGEDGSLRRKEYYTAGEYNKAESVRVPETTVLYVTEDRL